MLFVLISSKILLIGKSVAIFAVAMIITRLAGLRTFAKMSSIDFASTIAIGSVLAGTILNDSIDLATGALALAMIIAIQVGSAALMKKFTWFNRLASNQPVLLMRHGVILEKNLDASGVSKEDLMAKLREANALKFSSVKAVVFETTGDIAVLHSMNDDDIDEEILFGVKPFDEQQ